MAITSAYPDLLLIYPIGIIKVIHCLNDLQILIFFFEGKIDIWRKPTLEGKGPDQLGRSKRNFSKIMKFLHEWDPVKLLLFFLFSATSLLGCLPREQLRVTRQPWVLVNQWECFLHFMETIPLALCIKQVSRANQPTKCKLLYPFSAGECLGLILWLILCLWVYLWLS